MLRKELKQREVSAVAEVFAACKVVTATCTGCGDKLLRLAPAFDVVVIDEAAQALEAWCWIAMCKAPKVILAGDHLQLPPTVTSDEAARAGESCALGGNCAERDGALQDCQSLSLTAFSAITATQSAAC